MSRKQCRPLPVGSRLMRPGTAEAGRGPDVRKEAVPWTSQPQGALQDSWVGGGCMKKASFQNSEKEPIWPQGQKSI